MGEDLLAASIITIGYFAFKHARAAAVAADERALRLSRPMMRRVNGDWDWGAADRANPPMRGAVLLIAWIAPTKTS